MASLDSLLREQRRQAQQSSPFAAPRQGGVAARPAQGAATTTPGTRVSAGGAKGFYKPANAKPYVAAKDSSTVDLSNTVTSLTLPDGTQAPVEAPSGAPYLIRKPGSRSTLLDPQTQNQIEPDFNSPTGFRDVTAEKEAEQTAKATERSRVEQARIYDRALKSVEADKKEAVRMQNADKTNQYLAQGRKYFVDRTTGEPVPLQSDDEFEFEKSEKAKKAAEASRAKAIASKLKELDLEADQMKLDRPILSDSELKAAKENLALNQEGIVAAGKGLDDASLDEFAAVDPANQAIVAQYRAERDRLKADEETRTQMTKLERRKLDLRRQALDPEGWKAEKVKLLTDASDADLDAEMKDTEDLIGDLEERARLEAEPIEKRDQELTAAYQTAQEKLKSAKTGIDRIRYQRDVDAARARLESWNVESADSRASANETYRALNDRVEVAKAAQETRQKRAQEEKQAALMGLEQSPFLAPYAQRIRALDQEEAKRTADLVAQHPDGIPPEAQEALAADVAQKRQTLNQELTWANQTKDANLRALYEKYGSKSRVENWLTEPNLEQDGQWFNIMQEAKKVGLSEKEVREGLETSAALDWSRPRKVTGRKEDFSEDYRMLPDGRITVNPRYLLDHDAYVAAVESSPATQEQKESAIAMRRELAATTAARAFQELMIDPTMGAWLNANTKGAPLERLEQFDAEFKKGGAITAAMKAFQAGSGSLAAALFGAYSAATGSDTAREIGGYYNQYAQAYNAASEAAGKGTGTMGRFLSKVAGAVPSVAPGIAVGLATGGAGLPASAGLITNALTAGLQGLGGTYLDAYDSYQQQGLSATEARAKALTPAIASGLATSLITAAGGARGAESVLAATSTEAIKTGLRASLGRVLGNASEEAIEELTDQLAQGIIAQATYAKDKDIQTILNEAIEAGLVGAVLGGGISSTKELSTRQPLAEPEIPAVVEDTGPLPEQQAAISAAISSFEPTPELLPPSVAENAQAVGEQKAAQDAASALVAISQGADLASLPAAQLEAIGYEKGQKGVAPRKGAQPLVYEQDGQLVIRQEALDWLDAEDQPAIRDQIGLTEQERLVQIQQQNEPEAAPTPGTEPESPAQEPIQEGVAPLAPSPEAAPQPTPEQEADLADQRALAEAQAQEAQTQIVATLPQPKAAPPSRRKAIGKGAAGPASYAEFPTDTDAEAFTYAGNAKKLVTGRNLSENDRKRLMASTAAAIRNVSQATGIPEQELRAILPEYTKAINQQGKATESGAAFQAESLADFVARRNTPQEAAKELEAPKPLTPAQDAAESLGIAQDGKIIKEGFAAKSGLKGPAAKKLQSAAKAIVETLDAAARIKGIDIKITNNPDEGIAAMQPDGTILLNARKMAETLARRNVDEKRVPREVVLHELIHRIAAARLSKQDYRQLWQALTPEMQETSLREYYGAREGAVELPATPDWVAGAEFFAQLIEARLKGKLASQVWENPTLAAKVRAMVEKFIAALKDLANATQSPEWREIINKQANAVEQDLREALKDAGVEGEFLGGDEALRSPEPPNAEIPSPIDPVDSDVEAPSEADDQEMMAQTLADLEALQDLRQDPEAMQALAEQIKNAPAGQKPSDRRNRALAGTTPETRAIQQAALVAQTADDTVEVQRQADVYKRAKEAIVKDRAAVEQDLFDAIDENGVFTTDQLAQAYFLMEMLQRESTLAPQDKETYRKLLKITNAWVDNKTATGRALAFMRDPQQTPLQRMREAIAVVGALPQRIRIQSRAAWTPNAKRATIRSLEKAVKDAKNAELRAIAEGKLKEAKAKKDSQEIIDAYAEENRRLQETILKTMNLTQDDIMLDPEDRYGMREAILETPAIKTALAAMPKPNQNAIRLAMLGYSDAAIATRVGLRANQVPAIVENFRQNILKPSMTASVRAGEGFGSFIRKGLDLIRGSLRAPFQGTLNQATQAGKLEEVTAATIEQEVDRILNFALQPARFRNKAGAMQAKVVTMPNGQKVRMYLPFDPDDARGFYRYARELSTRSSSAFDKIYEYWIDGILSGPQTQVANVAGNVAQIGWNYTFQRAAEALLNVAYQDPKSARLGEFPHVFRAFMKAVGPAWQQAKLAYDTEADNTRSEYLNEPLTVDFKDANLDKMGGQMASIEGKKGRVVRIPGRLLRFADAFFKTGILHAEATTESYREGRARGLSGKPLEAYMTTRMQDKGSDVWQKAMKTADELLFQSENWATKTAESIVRGKGWKESVSKKIAEAELAKDYDALEGLRKQMAVANFLTGIMRYIFPFVRTPTNILRVGIRKSGGVAISMLFNVANGLYQRRANGTPFLESYTKAKQVKDLSEMALAGLAWSLIAGMAEGDEDDDKKSILIVGTRPYGAGSLGEKEEVMRRYGGTQAIIIRNPATGKEIYRFAYGRYEPFSTALSVITDTMRELKQTGNKPWDSEKAFKLTGSIGAHLLAQAESKSFLQGLSSVMKTLEKAREGKFEPGPAAGKALVSGLVPNIIRQTMRNADDYQRDFASADWKHEAFPGGWFAETKTGPGGKPIKKSGNIATRLFVQTPNEPSQPTAEQTFQQYNLRNPDARIDRAPLTKAQYFAYGPDGKTRVDLTDRADQRLFRELYEKTYADQTARFVATNPTIKLAKPPIKTVEDAKDLNAKAIRETRTRFFARKKVQEVSQRATNTPPKP